jgi:hypothetical protein
MLNGSTRTRVWLVVGIVGAMGLALGMGTVAYAFLMPSRGDAACARVHELGDPESVNGPLVSWARRLDKSYSMGRGRHGERSCEAAVEVLEDGLPADQFARVVDCLAVAPTSTAAANCLAGEAQPSL